MLQDDGEHELPINVTEDDVPSNLFDSTGELQPCLVILDNEESDDDEQDIYSDSEPEFDDYESPEEGVLVVMVMSVEVELQAVVAEEVGRHHLPPLVSRTTSSSLPPLRIGSSPSTIDFVMGSACIPHTPTDPMGSTQQVASPASEVGDAASTLHLEWGRCDPQTKRIWVRPLGTTEFEPYDEIMDFIDNQIFRNFKHVWSTWKDVPKDTRLGWMNDFLNHYRWLPEDRHNLARAWHHRATTMFADKMHKVRYDIGKNAWCSESLKIQLKEKWKNCPKFQMRSAQNKENRAKQDTHTYAGGSIPISKHRQRIEASREVPPEKVD
ncbi:uncharacterized protein LOC133299909 isoform X2 [Gastrolobium bilobum]|uniref:uncharacterized protein LOC133299909 isoform X2 n=1 Tax=Gastrolobium bilobum TaxID=150636 RepID=UPI002AB13982|nr:uncharacterized protein LOC133299909 isoform X2 [Gastrolobium bilobum]